MFQGTDAACIVNMMFVRSPASSRMSISRIADRTRVIQSAGFQEDKDNTTDGQEISQ
ncbi:hypothetical protein VC83_05178 [Pseudogymnoascus destructans]|uniref:Uncharacterized protein n=1 Tax=Pseudogymnoascus destructans TaxID=655981 RepID=A0A177A743_9PEZI|nr:uncharacterized protein VC83_05178 [Pseudogymnoascus destructans]OAF57955.1 hypothetical protein VC83_05178 [Pseudogymnoascus destructans]